jgi:hypothetical protein
MVAADRRRACVGTGPARALPVESGRDRLRYRPQPTGPPRLAFLEQHDPLWIVERVAVQRQEVERFLWEGRFGVAPRDLCVVTPHLSVVDFYHSGTQTRIELTPRGWIDGVDFNRVAKHEELAPDALTRLQAVDRKTFKTRQDEVFRAWSKGLIPKFDPDGKPFTVAQQADLLAWCEAHRKAFFDACPSLVVGGCADGRAHRQSPSQAPAIRRHRFDACGHRARLLRLFSDPRRLREDLCDAGDQEAQLTPPGVRL